MLYALERLGCAAVTSKDEQTACVKAIDEGKDVFLWLPTGFGKSMCCEVLPFMFDNKLGRCDRICTYVALRYPRLRKNSNSRVIQILIKRMRKQ